MALSYVNLSGFQRGIAEDETAINCRQFSVTVAPEFKDKLQGITGMVRGFAVADPMGTLNMEGEIHGNTGIMAATFAAAFNPVNEDGYFGRSSGGWYLDTGTVEETREGWLSLTAELSSNFNVP